MIFSHKLPSPPLASEHALISCPLCKKAGREDFPQYQSECTYLPDTDRKFIVKARQIVDILDCDESDPEEEPQEYQPAPTGNQPTPVHLESGYASLPIWTHFIVTTVMCTIFIQSRSFIKF